ncbi:MAG TPA: glycosyltransferase family 2 protein [Bacteroidia bacterium]|nr:glycosyltransferase family 2 protein [Bacteroidia bacterium]
MHQKLEISIVIVSYNVWDYLDKCIRSILLQQAVVFEIIVVDNNSTDGTIEKLRTIYPSVRIISNKNNAGFSAANNQGIKEANGDAILLLNPDTEITGNDALRNMADYLSANTDIGILAPGLSNTDGSFQSSAWNFPRVTNILLELFYLHSTKHKKVYAAPEKIQAASGAALCLKKTLADKLGGLDEHLFWMEDVDLCYRAFKAGKKIVYYPGIKIIHHGGKSSVNKQLITIPNQIISKIKYFQKNGSWWQFILSDILSFLFILSRLIVFTVFSISGNSVYILKRRAYLRAFTSFIRFNFARDKKIIS